MEACGYSSIVDEGYTISAIPRARIRPGYQRQIVNYSSKEKPVTIVIDISARFLYYTMPDGKAMRYGISVGRDGFRWSRGWLISAASRRSPNWTPPAAMIQC